jgi:hypothetical protein
MVFLLLFGCAGMKDPGTIGPLYPASKPGIDLEPGAVLANLQKTNAGLISFKGIGKIKIWNAGSLQSTRMLWAAYQTDQLRLELVGLGGRPFSSVVYDGSRLYLSLHSERRFYQKKTRHADLNRLISIPITIRDAISILAGRVPLLKDANLAIEKDPMGDQYVLFLRKGGFRKRTAKIYLDKDMKTVRKYEMFHGKDRLIYRVEFLSRNVYGEYRIPNVLVISNDHQTRIQIDVDNIWPDTVLPPSVFILKPPD